jgi:hypothetical protein
MKHAGMHGKAAKAANAVMVQSVTLFRSLHKIDVNWMNACPDALIENFGHVLRDAPRRSDHVPEINQILTAYVAFAHRSPPSAQPGLAKSGESGLAHTSQATSDQDDSLAFMMEELALEQHDIND